MKIFALHGFLGLPSDWNHLQPHFDINAVNIYHPELARPNQGLMAWAESFNHLAAKNPQPKVLLAYSLGGRLALHALLLNSKQWEGAIIVSTHPGELVEAERGKRRLSDESWALRFMNDPWVRLMADWDSQPVFAASTPLQRREGDYDRSILAESLNGWSLSTQEDLRPKIIDLNLPIFWMNGEHDHVYTHKAKQLILAHHKSEKLVIPNAGHRIPWDNPDEFISRVVQFIAQWDERILLKTGESHDVNS